MLKQFDLEVNIWCIKYSRALCPSNLQWSYLAAIPAFLHLFSLNQFCSDTENLWSYSHQILQYSVDIPAKESLWERYTNRLAKSRWQIAGFDCDGNANPKKPFSIRRRGSYCSVPVADWLTAPRRLVSLGLKNVSDKNPSLPLLSPVSARPIIKFQQKKTERKTNSANVGEPVVVVVVPVADKLRDIL